MFFGFKDRRLECGSKSLLMGVLNVTPDSFSDGGSHSDEKAFDCARDMLKQGADIIDIGGESTRPGAPSVPFEEEIKRILPTIKKLRSEFPDCVISVDTRKAETAKAAMGACADIINDVSGLQYSEALADVAAETGAGLIIMHMRGVPETMQNPENLRYDDLLKDIVDFLMNAAEKAMKAGVKKENIMFDPGIGFSKDLKQNLEILGNIAIFKETGFPVLVGPSRKSFIGKILGEEDPLERKWGTAGVVSWLSSQGVDVVRVHDVKEMKQTLELFEFCRNSALRGSV
jgi:dihydropteroate synthase